MIASSETTFGVCFAEGDEGFQELPARGGLRHRSHGLLRGFSMVVNEKTARAFAMRYGIDVYALRIANVIEPHEYDMVSRFLANLRRESAMPGAISTPATSGDRASGDPEGRARPAGLQRRQRHRHHPTNRNPRSAERLLSQGPDHPRTRRPYEAPLSNRKAREVMGFQEAHNWRKYREPDSGCEASSPRQSPLRSFTASPAGPSVREVMHRRGLHVLVRHRWRPGCRIQIPERAANPRWR